MKKSINILFILLRLFLGGMMVYAGVNKFAMSLPSSQEVVEKIEKVSPTESTKKLQKTLYINGLMQTGYFWQVLGICELLFGLMILIQGTSFFGAIFLLPITLHIFLIHAFLEPDEIGELFLTGALLVINIALVLKEKEKWKHLLWVKPI